MPFDVPDTLTVTDWEPDDGQGLTDHNLSELGPSYAKTGLEVNDALDWARKGPIFYILFTLDKAPSDVLGLPGCLIFPIQWLKS